MSSIKPIKKIWQSVFNLVLPPKCLACQTDVFSQGTICSGCYANLQVIGKHKCYKCGLPFEFDMGKRAVCSSCSYEKPRYDMARAYCKYDGLGGDLAVKLKFSDKTHLAPYMAKLMQLAGDGLLKKTDVITPIPLHFTRKLRRKYNQSALLAQNLAKFAGLEYDPFILKRTRNTKKQTTLPKSQRKKNMKNAFVVKKNVEGKKILIIDDVMTTGATINSAAIALKHAGAKKVYGLVFARVE